MKRLAALLAGLVILVVLCGLTTWRVVQAITRRSEAEAASAMPTSTPVEVLVAGPRDLVDKVAVAGTLRALHEADVPAEVPGRVAAVFVDVGANVSNGQALARLDDEDLRLQVRQAEAGLAAARAGSEGATRDFAGATSVAEVGGVTDAQLVGARSRAAAAEAQVQQAGAALAMAAARQAHAIIRAPFAGVVVRRSTDIGSQLMPGTPVFGIADLSELELVLEVDERVAAAIQPGQAVGVSSDTVANLPDGVVKTVAPMLDAASHKAQVVVGLKATPGLFGHGGATATFRLGHAEGVIAVPTGAILDDNGEQVVYVVTGTTAQRTVVQKGVRDGDWVEVRGLKPGSQVVVTGGAYLSDGAAVAVRTPGKDPS